MLNSTIHSILSIMGSPQVNNTVSLPTSTSTTTVSTSSLNHDPTSNSTALDLDGSDIPSADDSNNSYESLSPEKDNRDNSMSQSRSSSSDASSDQNFTENFEQNINTLNLNLDDPVVQKIAIQYLLGKVRSNETLLLEAVKENKILRDEVAVLYRQNDVLAAENVTHTNVISTQKNDNLDNLLP